MSSPAINLLLIFEIDIAEIPPPANNFRITDINDIRITDNANNRIVD